VIAEGDGAFYAPKLDFQLKDAIGRNGRAARSSSIMCCRSVSVRNMSARTAASIAPVMLHRAILGSLERFIGV
jgi:threonyl-tRNA synthetase